MRKKKETADATGFTIAADDYEGMVATMKELAARNSNNEAIVMRIAKAGGITEVVKHLIWLRNYMKKHQKPQRAQSESNGLPKPRRKGTSKRKRAGGAAGIHGGTTEDVDQVDQL